MASNPPPSFQGTLLQAEAAPGAQQGFEARYSAATGQNVSPGSPPDYQSQDNKWGLELRAYFNDPTVAAWAAGCGFHVEQGRGGYLSGKYVYRVNTNEFWWDLVESRGLRLGLN
jgi:hypothetical protein